MKFETNDKRVAFLNLVKMRQREKSLFWGKGESPRTLIELNLVNMDGAQFWKQEKMKAHE